MFAVVLVVVAGLLLALPAYFVDLLAYDRSAILLCEWWRLWSGHLTHYGWPHYLVDGGMVALLGWSVRPLVSELRTFLFLLPSMPLISILLLVSVPNLAEYRGLSALAAMYWVIACGTLLRRSARGSAPFWFSLALLAVLAIKILLDSLNLLPAIAVLPVGVQITWQAHLAGAVLGAIAIPWLETAHEEAN